MTDREKIDAIHAYLAHESLRLGNRIVVLQESADSSCNPVDYSFLALVYAQNEFFRHIAQDLDKILR